MPNDSKAVVQAFVEEVQIDIVRVQDGLIVEHWNTVNLLGAMQQMGAA